MTNYLGYGAIRARSNDGVPYPHFVRHFANLAKSQLISGRGTDTQDYERVPLEIDL